MNCERFQDLVHDLVREETLDTAAIEAALTHAQICNTCDARMEDAELLNERTHSLAARHASEQASPRIEEVLLRRFGQTRAPTPHVRARRRVWLMGAAGIAAAVALFVSVTVRRDIPQPGTLPQPQVAVAAENIYGTEADVAVEGSAANSFVSLSPTFDSSSLDEDAIVRVVLSDSALESFGFPASEVGRGQVVADLAVASDGIPQAIRVVGW